MTGVLLITGGAAAAFAADVAEETEVVALFEAVEGIRVNSLRPSMVRTDMTEARLADPESHARMDAAGGGLVIGAAPKA